MNDWQWKPGYLRDAGSVGSAWMNAVSFAVPFVTVAILLVMMYMIGGTLTISKGALFDMPKIGLDDVAVTESVALIVPIRHETLIFFEDSRYVIGNETSMRSFADRLTERFSRSAEKTLLVLVDRRVSSGDLMNFAARARKNGVEKILFAEKKVQEVLE